MKHDRSLSQRTRRAFVFLLITVTTASCVKLPRQYHVEHDSSVISPGDDHLDINKASAAELAQLPGIGNSIAQRIVEHRTRYGNFRRKEHLMMVRGISERKFRAVRSRISLQ